MVIPSKNIFIQGYQKQDSTYGFTHGDYEKTFYAPVGEKALIFAMGAKDDNTYFTMKEFTLGDFPVEHLKLELIDKNEAISIIKKKL